MTVEKSHGKARLTRPRVSDMGEGATRQRPTTRGEQNRENARYRGAKKAASAALRSLAAREVANGIEGGVMPEESRLVAQNALQLAGDAQREIGVASPFVAHHVARFGANAALSGYYLQKAGEAGFDTEHGLAMLDAAHRCEQRAERAMVAAGAALKEFAGKQVRPIDAHALVANVFGGKP